MIRSGRAANIVIVLVVAVVIGGMPGTAQAQRSGVKTRQIPITVSNLTQIEVYGNNRDRGVIIDATWRVSPSGPQVTYILAGKNTITFGTPSLSRVESYGIPFDPEDGYTPLLADISEPFSLAFSPDGLIAAVTTAERRLVLVDLLNRQTLRSTTTPTVTRVTFSPDGRRLALVDAAGRVALYDTATLRKQADIPGLVQAVWKPALQEIEGYGSDMVSAALIPVLTEIGVYAKPAFSPDSRFLAIPLADAVSVIDLTTNTETYRLKHALPPSTTAFTSDGSGLLSAADSDFVAWDVAAKTSQPMPWGGEEKSQLLAFSTDGRFLLSANWGFNGALVVSHIIRPGAEIYGPDDHCGNGRVWQFALGDTARVIPEKNSVFSSLRRTPGGEVELQIGVGELFRIVGGPECTLSNGVTWWQVIARGRIGWVSEGNGSQYFIEYVDAGTWLDFIGGQACPYLFHDSDDWRGWQLVSPILVNHNGPQNKRIHSLPIQTAAGRVLIREMEPETTYLDRLYLVVLLADGRRITLPADIPTLHTTDGQYVILNQGDGLLISFPNLAELPGVVSAYIVSEGYYIRHD